MTPYPEFTRAAIQEGVYADRAGARARGNEAPNALTDQAHDLSLSLPEQLGE
jgi:hypothetical protein